MPAQAFQLTKKVTNDRYVLLETKNKANKKAKFKYRNSQKKCSKGLKHRGSLSARLAHLDGLQHTEAVCEVGHSKKQE